MQSSLDVIVHEHIWMYTINNGRVPAFVASNRHSIEPGLQGQWKHLQVSPKFANKKKDSNTFSGFPASAVGEEGKR